MDIDAVITDIDGVLVDTSDSYHRAIVESVRTVYGETIDRSETQAFKNAGGFNNDWLTTDAVALYILAVRQGYEKDAADFADAIATHGGGLESAKAVLGADLSERAHAAILDEWDPTELRRTFQWLYLGPERYHAFEDNPPPVTRPDSAGYMDEEPIILEPDTRHYLLDTYTLGVLTGRPKVEASIALERVGIDPPDRYVRAMEDWAGGKPDPAGLISIASACDAASVLYIGDELDDVKTAVNANETDGDVTYYGIGVLTGGLTGGAGIEAFLAVGATAVLPSINKLPGYLDSD